MALFINILSHVIFSSISFLRPRCIGLLRIWNYFCGSGMSASRYMVPYLIILAASIYNTVVIQEKLSILHYIFHYKSPPLSCICPSLNVYLPSPIVCPIYSISVYSMLYTSITQCPILLCILYLSLGYLSFALYTS